MDKFHSTWRQGFFVDKSIYSRWSKERKEEANREEQLLVRPYPTQNAICRCQTPDEASWIAHRLNLASKMEQAIIGVLGYKNGKAYIDMLESS